MLLHMIITNLSSKVSLLLPASIRAAVLDCYHLCKVLRVWNSISTDLIAGLARTTKC